MIGPLDLMKDSCVHGLPAETCVGYAEHKSLREQERERRARHGDICSCRLCDPPR